MFGHRYFGGSYFGQVYFGQSTVGGPAGHFGHAYFAARYFGPHYFSPRARIIVGLALDGSASATGTPPASLTLTTTQPNDVVVFVCVTNGPSGDAVLSLSDAAGLTWRRRSLLLSAFPAAYSVYWATAPNPLSADVISFTLDPAVNFADVYAFAVSGANTANPWDPDPSLPEIEPDSEIPDGGNGTISTSNAAGGFLFGVYGSGLAGPSAGAGWTEIENQPFVLVEYNVVTAKQTNLTVAATVGNSINFIADAIVPASTSRSEWLIRARRRGRH